MASPPFEDRLMVATRMRDSAFKRALKRIPLGTTVKIDGPSGSLTLHKNSSKPAVFLAGGIGINRRPEDAPFLDTLTELQRANPNFRFVPTMTEIEKSQQKWTGETVFIDGGGPTDSWND